MVEVGTRVSGFKVGDHVALDPFGHCGRCGPCPAGRFNYCDTPTRLGGAFAEFCIAPVTQFMAGAEIDGHGERGDARAIRHRPACGRAIFGLHAGDSAVVEGPGPIGLSAALSARALGVTSIVITGLEADAERLALAREMGFKTVCASDRDWIDQVRALMPPDGADVVFDASGALDSARHLVRKRGGEWSNSDGRRATSPATETALALLSRRQHHPVARAHARDLAARNRDGRERRGRSETDGDASLSISITGSRRSSCCGAPGRQGADHAAGLRSRPMAFGAVMRAA